MSFPLGFKQAAPGIVDRSKMLLSMSLVLLSFKLFLIHSYASQCPFWDEWDDGCRGLFLPYLQGKLDLESLYRLHNEHMLVFTRISSLILFEFMGRWDTVAQMVFNSAVHVAALYMFVHYITRSLPDYVFGLAALFITLFLVVPVGWENLLWGFQSQIYFFILFAVASLKSCLEARFLSKEWMVGVFFGFCSFANIASGSVVFAVLFGFSAARLMVSRERKALVAAECLTHLAIFTLMYASIPRYEHHAALKAHSIGNFIDACSVILSWPHSQSPWHALVLWTPTALLALNLLGKGMPRSDKSVLVLALSAFVLATGLVLAYGRANALFPSRYLDMVSLGVLTNSAAALTLLERMGRGRARAFAAFAVLGFFCWIGFSANDMVQRSREEVHLRHDFGKKNEENVTAYIKTGDTTFPAGKRAFEVPYPDYRMLLELLAKPMVRGMLPPEFGNTEEERRLVRDNTLLKGRLSGIATTLKDALLKASPFLLAASAIGFMIALYLFFRSIRDSPGWRFR
jgi:hypothetical protein